MFTVETKGKMNTAFGCLAEDLTETCLIQMLFSNHLTIFTRILLKRDYVTLHQNGGFPRLAFMKQEKANGRWFGIQSE